MLTFLWYLLKVMLCSGVLFGYYLLALRNKKFHLYNRFYLLAGAVFSWIIPSIKIDLFQYSSRPPQAIKLLTLVANGNQFVQDVEARKIFRWETAVTFAFCIVSVIFLTKLFIAILRIGVLIATNRKEKWNNVYCVFTSVKGTPFSFFRYIFWNPKISLDTSEGVHILKHELVHVEERHSVDKLFIDIVLIIGWYDPFVWLIRKELNMIHEFMADKKAIQDGDTEAFASMLLKAAYPEYSFPLTNSFFYSPIKRRLLMLTSSEKTPFTYLRRVAVLLLLIVISALFAFTLKKEKTPFKIEKFAPDASSGQLGDKDILNEQQLIAAFDAVSQDTTRKKKGNPTSKETSGKTNQTITDSSSKDTNVNIDVSQKNSNENLNKTLVIVDGKQMKWEQFEKTIKSEQIQSMNVFKGATAIEKYGDKGKDGVIEITLKGENSDQKNYEMQLKKFEAEKKINELQQNDFAKQQKKFEDEKKINEVQQKDFEVAKKKYELEQKKQEEQSTYLRVFTVVENPPYYANGMASFARYINSNIQYPIEAIQAKVEGAVLIQFIVNEEGKLTDFKKLSSKGHGLEEEAIRLLKNSGDWKPGTQNGHKVPVQIQQQVIFELPSNQ